MALLAHKLRTAAGLLQTGLTFVGAHQKTVTGSNPSIELNTLSGGIASFADAGDLVIGACASASTGFGSTSLWADASVISDNINDGVVRATLSIGRKRLSAPQADIQWSAPTSATYNMIVSVWRNSHASTPMDVAAQITKANDATAPNAPAITTVTPGAIVLAIAAGRVGTTGLTMPPDMGFWQVTADGRLAHAGANMTAPGTYDPAAFGHTAGANPGWIAATLAIRPA